MYYSVSHPRARLGAPMHGLGFGFGAYAYTAYTPPVRAALPPPPPPPPTVLQASQQAAKVASQMEQEAPPQSKGDAAEEAAAAASVVVAERLEQRGAPPVVIQAKRQNAADTARYEVEKGSSVPVAAETAVISELSKSDEQSVVDAEKKKGVSAITVGGIVVAVVAVGAVAYFATRKK